MMAVNPKLVSCRSIVWLVIILAYKAEAERHFFSYETVARSLDDGRRSFNEIRGSAVDSQQGSHSFRKTFVEPSRFNQGPNSIESKRHHMAPSKPMGPLMKMAPEQRKQFEESFMKQLASHGGVRRGFLRHSNIRPRTVESPALSVDSGRGASSKLANAISKVFRVEQGHYADIYDRIDNRKPLSTKRPAELIDETIEGVLVAPRRQPTAGHRHRDD